MKFTQTPLNGAWIIDPEPHGDERGYFARVFCRKEFEAHGIEADVVQSNVSYSQHAGTLRGMHFQKAPAEETKLVRCLRGALLDVIIDIRPDSPTLGQYFSVELTTENKRMLFVPRGFAHGFQTLSDDTEMLYMVSEYYTPEAEGGHRYNDPAFGIKWPLPVSTVSDKDASWPLVSELKGGSR
jgi:dTDP-4-dehydrorhamnose 3,5-epimerase